MTLQKKLVIVGNSFIKNYLLYTFERGVFIPQIPRDWAPSELQVQWEEQAVEFKIFNPCFKPQYERLRPGAYHNSDVVLACFALDSPESLEYIGERVWMETRLYCPETPVILVGIKSDLRDAFRKEKEDLVSVEDALLMADKISAVDYIECSPKTKVNVGEVFVRAAEVTLLTQSKRKKKKKKKKFGFCCTKN